MKDPRYPRRKPLSREELAALQRERDERIEAASVFPWTRLVVAAVIGVVAIAATGGGAVSLMVATLAIIIVLAGKFKPRPPVK